MAVVGADHDAETEASQVGGVFVAITERAADQVADGGVQAQRESGGGLDPVPVGVVGVRQQVCAVRVRGQRFVVLGVVALPGGLGAGVQRGVEVVAGAVLADTGGDQPEGDLGLGFVLPDRAASALHPDLEQDGVLDRADALVRSVKVGELLAGFGQQRMLDGLQLDPGRQDRQVQILAQAAQGGTRTGARSAVPVAGAAEFGDPFRGQPGERGDGGGERAVQDLHRLDHPGADPLALLLQVDPSRFGDEVFFGHAQKVRPLGDQYLTRATAHACKAPSGTRPPHALRAAAALDSSTNVSGGTVSVRPNAVRQAR